MTMDPDALTAAHSRYEAAHDAYRKCTQRVAETLQKGLLPSAEETAEEIAASERLVAMRRDLFDVIAILGQSH